MMGVGAARPRAPSAGSTASTSRTPSFELNRRRPLEPPCPTAAFQANATFPADNGTSAQQRHDRTRHRRTDRIHAKLAPNSQTPICQS